MIITHHLWLTKAHRFHVFTFLSSFVHFLFISFYCFLFYRRFQIDDDLEDLEQALQKNSPRHIKGSGSCSALIKLLPENKEMFISHVTWNTYIGLLRIFKLYDLPFKYASRNGKIYFMVLWFHYFYFITFHQTCILQRRFLLIK